MKKIIAIFLLSYLMLYSCNNNKASSNNTTVDTSEIEENILKSCNFTMDLTLYNLKEQTYDYKNNYGQGTITTDFIYITCEFYFTEIYQIDEKLILTVNENEVFSLEINSEINFITFLVEDTNWSNYY